MTVNAVAQDKEQGWNPATAISADTDTMTFISNSFC